MEPGEVVEHIADRLRADGFTASRVALAGHDSLVARRSDFRLRWIATRLHTFVAVFAIADLDEETAQKLTAAAQQYAIDHKGGLPRGLQTGTATIAVFVTGASRPWLHPFFRDEPKHRFAALRLPVLVELDGGGPVYFKGESPKGAFYLPHLRQVVERVVP